MATEAQNPCTFKTVCKTCRFVKNVNDRPLLCKESSCPEYTPCSKCGKNVALYKDKKCAGCTKEDAAPTTEDLGVSSKETFSPGKQDVPASKNGRVFSVTVPGQAPPEYNEEEKSYYERQWLEYEGYYRDPSAYPVCHAIILGEIELNHVNSQLINIRYEEDQKILESIDKRQERIINTIAKLRAALPAKEAIELSEDEKAISAIYERYAQEQLKRRVGNVSRVLSPEAVALAPCLPFPVGLADILTRLGYKSVDIENAFRQVEQAQYLPKDPKTLLEALGMILSENVVSLETISGNRNGTRQLAEDVPDSPALDFPEENPIEDGQQG